MSAPSASPVFAAVDLGATSGRVLAGVVDDGAVELHEMHRFDNGPQLRDGHLRWDIRRLYEEVLRGLARVAARFPSVASIGIDSWGVDYALLGDDLALLDEPISYRDPRTSDALVGEVHERVAFDELYSITGVQFLPFNTIYQLAVDRQRDLWPEIRRVVLLPDLLAYWLTGELRSEATIASTTGLVDVSTGDWSTALLERLDIPRAWFPSIDDPGTVRGTLRADVCDRLGLNTSTVVTAVASHDTASAVVGVPANGRSFGYVSSGTWSLVGLELDAPIATADARLANFTNERGVDHRVRFLRNVGGLWLLEECRRAWAAGGSVYEVGALFAAADAVPDTGLRFRVDDPAFVAPGEMPARIAAAVGVALTPAQTVRCIVDSLADSYAQTLRTARDLAHVDVDVVHVVGGGSQIDSLCRRTAEVTGLPVVAGPTEATAFGNVLVQARAHGCVPASVEAMRSTLTRSVATRRFEPSTAGAAR